MATITHPSRITSIIGTYALATESERIAGDRWYPSAHTDALNLSREYPVSVITAAGVIAALSPNNRWDRNLLDAAILTQVFTTYGPAQALQVKLCTYNANKQKALTILKLASADVNDVATILNGQKVTSFFKCILGDTSEVCVDGHAYSIWAGETISTTRTPRISPVLYAAIQSDYRRAANALNEKDGHGIRLTPSSLQAITWVAHRRLIKG